MRIVSGLSTVFVLGSMLGCDAGPSCGSVTDGSGTPSLRFTKVPPIGSTDSLEGRVEHVAPVDDFVAVYIKVNGGWWTKPTFADPDTSINCDGSWTADISTGGEDTQATAISAFLLPIGYAPPALGGSQELPQELFTNSVASASVVR